MRTANFLAGIVLCLPIPTFADWTTEVVPSVAASAVYDSNVLLSADAASGFFIRLSPALEARAESKATSIAGFHSFDAERYTDHAELDSSSVRERTRLELDHQGQALTFGFDATRHATEVPGELNVSSGIQLGRAAASSIGLRPEIEYRFAPDARGRMAFDFTRDRLDGGVESWTRAAEVEYGKDFSRKDQVAVGLVLTRYSFNPGGDRDSTWLYVNWDRQLSRRTGLSASLGPRVADDNDGMDLQVRGAIHHTVRRGFVRAEVRREETTLIGEAGTTDVASFTFGTGYRFPFDLSLAFDAGVSTIDSNASDARALRAEAQAWFRVNRYTGLAASWQYFRQTDDVALVPGITRNMYLLTLVLSLPVREPPTTADSRFFTTSMMSARRLRGDGASFDTTRVMP